MTKEQKCKKRKEDKDKDKKHKDNLDKYDDIAKVRLSKGELMNPRIVVVTLCSAGKIVSDKSPIPVGHFTHVFVDEAGQATEPETLIAVSGILSSSGQLVLAGDPHQLSAVVKSPVAIAYGLCDSLMERLMETCAAYQKNATTGKRDPRQITKLVKNFRSHEQLLTVPSKLFYDGELIPCANKALGDLP